MTIKIPIHLSDKHTFKSDADGKYEFARVVNGVTHFNSVDVDALEILAGGKTWAHLVNTKKSTGHNIPQLYFKTFPHLGNYWGAPVLFDFETTNGENRALALKMKDTSTTGTLAVTGLEIQIESPCDRESGDSSGIYIMQKGGGNCMSIYHHSTTFPNSGFGLEVGANGESSAIYANVLNGKCLLGKIEGATGAGVYLFPSADTDLTRRALKIGNAACDVEKFFVTLCGQIYTGDKVGIGVSAPLAPLHISGQTKLMQLSSNQTDDADKYSAIAGSQYDSGTETEGMMLIGHRGQVNSNEIHIGGLIAELNAATDIVFHTAVNTTTRIGTERARINSGGNFGVQTAVPANPLAVNRQADDGIVIDIEQADVVEGNISVSGNTVSYNAFMGAHYTQLKDGQKTPPVGAIVIATGEIIHCEAKIKVPVMERYYETDKKTDRVLKKNEEPPAGIAILERQKIKDGNPVTEIKTKEVGGIERKEYFSYVERASQKADKRVYGVYHAKLSDDAKGHSFGRDNKPIHQIAALGLYKVRVTDTNGDIAAGDYTQSSIRPGEGEKQGDDVLHNYTVAKSIIDVDWNEVTPDSRLGYKWQLIPATLHCG